MADWFDENAPQQQQQADWFDANAPTPTPTATPQAAAAPQTSLTDELNISGVPRTDQPGDIFRGAQLGTVPLDVAKTLVQTPLIEGVRNIARTGEMLSDVIFGGKPISEAAVERFPESQKFVGIEQKPIRERAKTGLETLTNLMFAGALGEGLRAPEAAVERPVTPEAPAVEPAPTEAVAPEALPAVQPVAPEAVATAPTEGVQLQPVEPIPVQAEQAVKEVIPSAIEERKVEEGVPTERPGDGEGRPPAEAGVSGGVRPAEEVIPKGEEVTPEYQAASEKANDATREFRAVSERYRKGEIGDTEFLDARAEYLKAQSDFDKAFAAEQSRSVPSIGDTVTFEHPTLGELSGSVTRELSDGSLEVKTPQGDITAQPEELTPTRKSLAGQREEQVPTPFMEARMQREHEAELRADFEQHMLRGGEELGDVLKRVGLPALSSARKEFAGELQNIREAWKGTRGDPTKPRIRYADIFKKDAPDIDEFTQTLKRAGFDVETEADALNLVENWMRTGQPVYGSEARGVALEEQSMGGMGAARAGEISQGGVVGMKNRMVDEERAKRGWLPLMGPARQDFGGVWDKAVERIENGEKLGQNVGQDMVNDVLTGRLKAVSNEDQAVLTHEYIRQRNERDMASDRINDPSSSLEDRLDAQMAFAAAEDKINQAELALHDAGTLAGRSLAFRRTLMRDDFTYAGMERRLRAAKGGEPLSEDEVKDLQTKSDELTKIDEAIATRQGELEVEAGQKAIDLTVTGLKKRAASQKADPGTLDAQREKIQEGLLDRAEEGDSAQDVSGLIHQLALNFVRSGVSEREALIDSVHGVVGDIFGLSREETRDAISGYGKFKQLDPEAAKVQLRQLKGEMQQIGKLQDMAEGIAPRKTGVERRTPSDEERQLIRQVNEMKKKGGFEVTDPATQLKSTLDAVKTRLQNQIRDLHNAIVNREPILNKRGEIQYDEEATKLQTIRDALKAQYEEIFGKPEMTDEQRLKAAQSAAERSLRDWQTRLDEAQQGIFKTPDKKTLSSPEIDAIREQREAVKAEVEALAKLDPGVQASRAEQALATYKQRLTQRIADMQEKIARGDFTREKVKPPPRDTESLKLQAQAQKIREEFERGIMKQQLENRTTSEWLQDKFLKYRRAFVLSWPTIFTKLTSAAFLRTMSEPIEAGIRRGLGLLPGVKEVAERAPIGGQTSVASVANATAKAFTEGLKDSWQTLTTGKSELDRLYGRPDVVPREWVDFFGTLHAVLKAPVKRYGFELAYRDQVEHAIRNGVEIDPIVDAQMALRAYAHGERLIFLQNNRAVSAFNMAMRRLEQPEKVTGRPSVSGKILSTVAKTPLPVLKVPTNILSEIFDYTFGGFSGGAKLYKALREPIENLKPEQAETIMRQLSKGSLGGALLILGYLNRDKIGGYYQRGEKRKPEEPKPGEIIINGHRFTHDLFHSAIAGPLMVGATMGRVADTQVKGVPKGAAEGVMHALLGPVTEVPFFTGVERLVETAKAPSLTTAAGQELSDIAIPGLVQQAARMTDKTPEGEVTKRIPHTFGEAFKAKLPGLRQTVPEKKTSKSKTGGLQVGVAP